MADALDMAWCGAVYSIAVYSIIVPSPYKFYLLGDEKDNFRRLTEEQRRQYQERFSSPKMFLLGPNGQLIVLPVEAAP